MSIDITTTAVDLLAVIGCMPSSIGMGFMAYWHFFTSDERGYSEVGFNAS